MQKLNQPATKIFGRLLEKMGAQEHTRIHSEGFMPLVIERLEESIKTEYGPGNLISIAHYYSQNGDAMRDPEIVFLVVDLRKTLQGEEYLFVFPTMYQQDNLGIYEQSVTIENNAVKAYKPHWQKAHVNFANGWLRNIKQQGFLK